MHLATRDNNKILLIPPPHMSNSEERPPRLTLAQLRTNKYPFLKSYLYKVDAKTHPSPLSPRRSDCTDGQMDEEAGWWTTSGNIGLSPLARVMGVGRQQHSADFTLRKKQFLDFSLLSARCFPYKEWASLVSCLVFSHSSTCNSLDVGWCNSS